MRDKARVISVEEKTVQIMPIISDACINCDKSSCSTHTTPFTVTNPKKLEVKPGMLVRIGANKTSQAIQAIVSLFIPIGCAIGGFFAVNTFLENPGEGLKILGVLIGLFCSSGIILTINHFRIPQKSKIIEIL
jgi:hypothetical protein